MARRSRTPLSSSAPTGRLALGTLARLAAWRYYVPDNPADPALAELHAKHEAERPDADTAVVEAWTMLERCGALAEFEAWQRSHGGYAAHWPTAPDGRPRPI